MTDREKVIKGLEACVLAGTKDDCIGYGCPYLVYNDEVTDDCQDHMFSDALAMLKAQEPREITKEEWEQWKKTPDGKRDPLYFMWVDCAPGLWTTSPERINEVAYLTGEIKIWNKKPNDDVMMKIQQDTWTQQGK